MLLAVFGVIDVKVDGFAFDVVAVERYAATAVCESKFSAEAHVVSF